jgi:hypothetical protein
LCVLYCLSKVSSNIPPSNPASIDSDLHALLTLHQHDSAPHSALPSAPIHHFYLPATRWSLPADAARLVFDPAPLVTPVPQPASGAAHLRRPHHAPIRPPIRPSVPLLSQRGPEDARARRRRPHQPQSPLLTTCVRPSPMHPAQTQGVIASGREGIWARARSAAM